MGADQRRPAAAEERRAEGRAFGPSLVGLGVEEAVNRATDRGFDPQVISHRANAITADLRYNRLRLFLDEDETVVRVTAG